ncbi:MAG TPA: hypothetical protein VF576_13085 [Rubricoccaceae bacterium]
MHPLLRAAPALFGPVAAGPPLRGIRLVVPLLPFLAGPGARLEVGFERGRLVVRLVQPGPPPSQPAWTDPSWADPDADLGPHDFHGRY